ncbi:AAA domain-containing protein [Caldisericum exile]|uniref:AAA domain-containing protein n=1 Tax=Caldisericum exile TaxID=693075 RepID=UPI003C75666D
MELKLQEYKFERLIKYLEQIFNLKRKIIRRVDEYEEVLWLCDISNVRELLSIFNNNSESNQETLIEVILRDPPKRPDIPKELKEYIELDRENVKNPPKLKKEINFSYKDTIERFFQDYYAKWENWSQSYVEWGKIYEVYKKLFRIYFELKRYEELYEVVVGCGLLTWQLQNNQIIQRHVLTAKCIIEFHEEKKKFSVLIDQNEISLNFEHDMIDIEFIPPSFISDCTNKLYSYSSYDLFSDKIKSFLQAVVHTLHPKGKFIDINQPNLKEIPTVPKIEFAPAIILRKRIDPYINWLNILQNLESKKISPLISDLAESGIIEDNKDKNKRELGYFQIYFPKPYNKEQEKILEKLYRTDMVVVQGPPGTGKSHTIANLISHLLADGKRVLITAKTSRALYVLRKLIPQKLRTLCVWLLGESVEEKRLLEISVGEILIKWNEWRDKKEELESQIQQLEERLKQINNEFNKVNQKIIEILNSDNDILEIGSYKGSLSEIIMQFEQEKEFFNWFKDNINAKNNWPPELGNINWAELINLLNFYSKERREELNKYFPQINELPPLAKIEQFFNKEKNLLQEIERMQPKINVTKPSTIDDLDESIFYFEKFYSFLTVIKEDLSLEWVNELYTSLLKNQTIWIERIENLKNFMENLNKEILSWKCFLPPEKFNWSYFPIVIKDIEVLINHFQNRNKLKWWIFKPKIIREKEYLIKNSYINGEKCNNIENLKKLKIYLETLLQLEEHWQPWQKFSNLSSINTEKQKIEILQNNLEIANKILGIKDLIYKCRDILNRIGVFDYSIWLSERKIFEVITYLNYLKLLRELTDIQSTINNWIISLNDIQNKRNCHEIIMDLLESLKQKKFEKNIKNLSTNRRIKYTQGKIKSD